PASTIQRRRPRRTNTSRTTSRARGSRCSTPRIFPMSSKRRLTPMRCWDFCAPGISNQYRSEAMNDEKRYRRGANRRRKILGDAWVDRADANRNSFNAEWQDFITRCAWGEVWTRPHFDERTRRVLVIGTMMAIGRWEEFRMHLRAALVEGGFSPDDI